MATEFIEVVTTVADKQHGEEIAARLVEERLAACVQLAGPVQSFYKWQGKLEKDEEYQLFIKSEQLLYNQLHDLLLEIHPYEVPQLIVLPIKGGSHDYLNWLAAELKGGDND